MDCADKEGLTVCGMTVMLAIYVSAGNECRSQTSSAASHNRDCQHDSLVCLQVCLDTQVRQISDTCSYIGMTHAAILGWYHAYD